MTDKGDALKAFMERTKAKGGDKESEKALAGEKAKAEAAENIRNLAKDASGDNGKEG